MIDPILSLVFSFANNKGAYALLLGSGISRPSGIPTGWEIVLDLIKKLAQLNDETIDTSPEKWYVQKFNEAPNYSFLLNEVFKTSSERNNFLKQYFEPTDTEKEQGLKVPTKAHTSIAKLVKHGFVKVIITTNFDRLLEVALEKENITPNIISTPDNLLGSLPIIHSNCTIIKINGDYLDTRIRNTSSELEEYEDELNQLLDRVFDEFGLIVCGWSAEWDVGLRKAIERCKSRRFTTYWITKDHISEYAEKIIDFRTAININNTTADIFFTELLEKTLAITEVEKPHPISSKIAIATSKKYLSDSKFNISLHDLVLSETKKVISDLSDSSLSVHDSFSEEEFRRRIAIYESKIEILLNILITIAYWGKAEHISFINKSIESVANSESIEGGLVVYINLKKYPSLLLMYGASIAALVTNKYAYLKSILVDTIIRNEHPYLPLVSKVVTYSVMEKEVAAKLPGRNERNYTPFSDYLSLLFQKYFDDYIFDKNNFYNLFDKFEYILALIYADVTDRGSWGFWAPVGSFGWRNHIYSPNNTASKVFERELDKYKEEHPILKVGLFNNSFDKLIETKKELDDYVSRLHWR
ncbi:MAG: SIR2 family protein [Melioribacteraceae bacterium]|nr:SIR2 family protein [Melioribacteraceae bacterium]